MKKINCLLLMILSTTIISINVNASPTFPDLSQDDFDHVINELSANTTMHSVMPPSSMGALFGFEIGLVGGVTKTPDINNLVQQASPGTEVAQIPHAGLLGALTIPLGLTAEVMLVPKVSSNGIDYSSSAAALKWDMSAELFPVIPINVALRGFYSQSQLSFVQVIKNTSTGNVALTTDVGYSGHVEGLQILLSPQLPLIEPYIGLGELKAEGKIDVGGNASIYKFTTDSSAEGTPTSGQFILGADLHLGFFGLGAEYSRQFATNCYTAKASFRF